MALNETNEAAGCQIGERERRAALKKRGFMHACSRLTTSPQFVHIVTRWRTGWLPAVENPRLRRQRSALTAYQRPLKKYGIKKLIAAERWRYVWSSILTHVQEMALRIQQRRNELQTIVEKIGEIESDADEHRYVCPTP